MNPAIALAKMMAALIDQHGRIQVPGFYDDVVPLTERERKQFATLPFDEAEFKKQIGVTAVGGEEGYTTLERRIGAADVRYQRPDERLSRRRGEDGVAGQGECEVQLPPGAESGSEENRDSRWKDICGSYVRRASRWN